MWIKLLENDKIVFCKNIAEFVILTFNKEFEYINLGERL